MIIVGLLSIFVKLPKKDIFYDKQCCNLKKNNLEQYEQKLYCTYQNNNNHIKSIILKSIMCTVRKVIVLHVGKL